MSSPSLLALTAQIVTDEYCQSVITQNQDWLLQLDIHPQPLLAWLEQRRCKRLGIYFENLLEFWLRERIAPGCVESHVRVFREKRVLGEFDFLFRLPGAGTVCHWESVVKFYLCHRDVHGACQWVGPNANDTLDNKLSRLLDHQLKLGGMPEAHALLHDKGFEGARARTFFKGYLFYPSRENWREPATSHNALATHHLKGWWTGARDLQIPGAQLGARYLRVPKLQWLAPQVWPPAPNSMAPELLQEGQLRDVLQRHFAVSKRAVLVAQLFPGENGHWREVSRGFVVSDYWPDNSA